MITTRYVLSAETTRKKMNTFVRRRDYSAAYLKKHNRATKVTYNSSRRRLSVLLIILLKSDDRWLISSTKRTFWGILFHCIWRTRTFDENVIFVMFNISQIPETEEAVISYEISGRMEISQALLIWTQYSKHTHCVWNVSYRPQLTRGHKGSISTESSFTEKSRDNTLTCLCTDLFFYSPRTLMPVPL